MKNRIVVDKRDKTLEIIIKAYTHEKKQIVLLIWTLLFSLCGLAIFTQLFYSYNVSTKVFFLIYLVFWSFFEFKVVYAYRWRKYGKEVIFINELELILSKAIGKRVIVQRFNIVDIGKIYMFEPTESGFVESMLSSYWNINQYCLAFEFENKPIPFALDIDKKEAIQLQKIMQNYLSK